MNQQSLLDFARREAGSLQVRCVIEPNDGDGFAISRQQDAWTVTGNNARSCLWGVYHLQDGGTEGSYKPRFALRGLNPCESLSRHQPEQIARLWDRAARWRMNAMILHHAYGYRRHADLIHRLSAERGIELIHYLQGALLFLHDCDPSLFAKTEDGDPCTSGIENETRLCASSASAVAHFAQMARRYVERVGITPGSRVVLIDADGYLFCRCPACRDLKPHEQWSRFFEAAAEAIDHLGLNLDLHYLAYVWRYRVPQHPGLIDRIDGVMFDTHQRYRWTPISQAHDLTLYNQLESQADPTAATQPLNVYLHERLRDWRRTTDRDLYIFENLMLQGTISCPQPNTPQLLDDLDLYEKEAVNGVIYEAFEPGIESFSDQLRVLSRAMWSDRLSCQPTELERQCAGMSEADSPAYHFKNCFNAIAYLSTDRFDGIALLADHLTDPVLQGYAKRLRLFLRDRSLHQFADTMAYVLANRNRFDWMLIAFNLARAVEPHLIQSIDDPNLRQFLSIDKLFDFLEPLPDIETNMLQIAQRLIDAARQRQEIAS